MANKSASTASHASCYILMPFSDEFLETYTKGIVPAIERAARALGFGISCTRADQQQEPGSITKEIVQGILQAKIVIADISEGNPNVFYELGIAHTLGRHTIMIARDLLRIPFDVRTYRVIEYSATTEGLLSLQVELSNTIKETISSTKSPSNPVQDNLEMRLGEILSTYKQVIEVEQNANEEIWIIGPDVEMDIMYYIDVVRTNIVQRSIVYKYILPNSVSAKKSWRNFILKLKLSHDKANLLLVKFIEEYMVESEIVIYNPLTVHQKVYLMPPIEQGFHFYYLADKSRARDIRSRFEVLWEKAEG